jgi:glycosyltransferase 2 family protein
MPDRPVGASVDVDAGEQAGGHQAGAPGAPGEPGASPDSGPPSPASAGGLVVRLARSRFVRWGFVAVTVGIGVYAVVRNWPAVHAALAKIGFGTAAESMLCVLVALLALLQIFRVLLGALGSPLPVRASAQILFVGQLGKYLPGSVWPVLAQMELGAAHQVPRRRSASASILTMLLSLLTGILVGLVMLPFSKGAAPYRWVFLFAPLLLVCLYPRLLNRIIDRLLRLARRPALEQPLTGGAVARALGWGIVMWICFGLQVWLMAAPLGLDSASGALLAIGAFAFAWCAGFVVILAPAGAGIREYVLLLLLGPAIGFGAAAAITLVSRVLMTLGDLVTAGTAGWLARRSRGATAAGTPGG